MTRIDRWLYRLPDPLRGAVVLVLLFVVPPALVLVAEWMFS